ncbi:hypothetical protein AALP_AA7G176600 [Arabis alpina]|uniref:Uncharacterized protein n=1 Tax=Arabis alpina TaxID=50452 RepID=A0A087GIR7_ARAAL|nr:hypothetical protein AALP_AA7G176600 [Arabis alpina]
MRPLSVQSRLEGVSIHATSASSSTFVNHHGVAPQSPWKSPVPYLFGGLAAMLGLIALALLILACSYWRLSSSGEEDGRNNGDEEKESRSGDKTENGAYEDKFLVIMAGDDLPRYLATPAMKKCTCGGKMVISQEEIVVEENNMGEENEEKVKEIGESTTTSVTSH